MAKQSLRENEKMGLSIGAKFYRILGDNIEIIRILCIVNSNDVRVKELKSGKVYKISYDYIEKNFAQLTPDGRIVFSIANLTQGVQDVIVALFRSDKYQNTDLERINKMPYAVCRQCITDVHGNMIQNGVDNILEVGSCTSVETLPLDDDFDYNMMLTCNSIETYLTVCVYMDDKLEDIIQCIRRISAYTKVLENCFNQAVSCFPYEIKKGDNPRVFRGYCKDLVTLLQNNDFMYDFRRAFGIADLSGAYGDKGIILSRFNFDEAIELNEYELSIIESAFGMHYNHYLCIRYAKDINLEEIHPGFHKFLFSDASGDVFLLVAHN